MSQVSDEDVATIRHWLTKQPHLPSNFDDQLLQRFLFSCENSLERTKRCLEKFCRHRQHLSDGFRNRVPTSPALKTAFSIAQMANYTAGNSEILIHQLIDTTDYTFYDIVKTFTLQLDLWLLRPVDPLPERHVIILDLGLYSLRLVAKMNMLIINKFIVFLLESMPIRLAEIHLVNCPSFYEYLYNLVKPVLPPEIRNLMKFHPGFEGLHEYIDKKYLPKEYGGDAESIQDKHRGFVKEIQEERDYYLKDLWIATGAETNATFENNINTNGSFKSLSID